MQNDLKNQDALIAKADQINVRSVISLTQTVLPLMNSPRKQMVLINSSVVLNPGIQSGLYASSKAVMKTIADSLRLELNSKGLRVLSIYPGRAASPMQARIAEFEQSQYTPEKIIQPEDIALIVVNSLKLLWTVEVTDIYTRPFSPSK